MIRRIKEFQTDALLSDDLIRSFLESFEREILRGIGVLCILRIIYENQATGIYGYNILKELKNRTNDTLLLEEGTLYPMLKKYEQWGEADNYLSILQSEMRSVNGRNRKYYRFTPEGLQIYRHLSGFFSKFMKAVSPLMFFDININEQNMFYCPNCSNQISLDHPDLKYCEMCGFNIEDIKNNRIKEVNKN
jgi:PadR family transcriptional regulator PadR